MFEKIDPSFVAIIKERRENGTLAITAGSIIAFGVAIGAIAIYDSIVKNQNAKDKKKE
jgi:hypothetical protein